MMMEEHWLRMQPLVVEATISLLGAYGLLVEYAGEYAAEGPPGEGLAAALCFTGDQMRGRLVIGAPVALLRHAYPHLRSGASLAHLQDWTGELANQLLGRIKRQLLVRGVTFALATPTAASAGELRGRCAADVHRLVFTCPAGTLCVEFAATLAAGTELLDPIQPSACPAEEGEVLLF